MKEYLAFQFSYLEQTNILKKYKMRQMKSTIEPLNHLKANG